MLCKLGDYSGSTTAPPHGSGHSVDACSRFCRKCLYMLSGGVGVRSCRSPKAESGVQPAARLSVWRRRAGFTWGLRPSQGSNMRRLWCSFCCNVLRPEMAATSATSQDSGIHVDPFLGHVIFTRIWDWVENLFLSGLHLPTEPVTASCCQSRHVSWKDWFNPHRRCESQLATDWSYISYTRMVPLYQAVLDSSSSSEREGTMPGHAVFRASEAGLTGRLCLIRALQISNPQGKGLYMAAQQKAEFTL